MAFELFSCQASNRGAEIVVFVNSSSAAYLLKMHWGTSLKGNVKACYVVILRAVS